MSTTIHPVAPEEIMAFVDGELPAERAQSISLHIEQCAECIAVRDALRDVSSTLSKWTIQAPPLNVTFDYQLAGGDHGHSSRLADFGGLGRYIFPRGRWQLVAATSTFIVLVIVLIGLSSFRYDKSMPASSRAAQRQIDAYSFSKEEIGGRSAGGATLRGQSGHLGGDTAVQFGPMIARTVSLSIVVKDFDASRAALGTILVRHNGYAAELNVATPQGAARALQGSLRVPAPQLVAAVAELKALGRVEVETQNGEEVTQQHADLVARLKNSRETEQRLQDVLRTRTGKVKDVLEVEEEIARVRGEIEQMEAEQQNLEHRVSFATIDLKLAEEYKAQLTSPAPSAGMQLRNAIVNGFRNASESLLGIILFFAEAGPTLLLWLAILFIPARLLWRRYRSAYALSSSSLGT
jgi:hypothetical protein